MLKSTFNGFALNFDGFLFHISSIDTEYFSYSDRMAQAASLEQERNPHRRQGQQYIHFISFIQWIPKNVRTSNTSILLTLIHVWYGTLSLCETNIWN